MSKIELIVTKDYDEMSQKAADIFIDLLKKKTKCYSWISNW